jgi:hypothetical protein
MNPASGSKRSSARANHDNVIAVRTGGLRPVHTLSRSIEPQTCGETAEEAGKYGITVTSPVFKPSWTGSTSGILGPLFGASDAAGCEIESMVGTDSAKTRFRFAHDLAPPQRERRRKRVLPEGDRPETAARR